MSLPSSLRAALAILAVVASAASALAGEPRIESHVLAVTLDPAAGSLTGRDVLTVLRDAGGKLEFTLNSALEIAEVRHDGRLASGLEKVREGDWITHWSVDVTPGPGERGVLVVQFAGKVQDKVKKAKSLSFVVGDDTRGVIGADGVYLTAASGWYPDDGGLATFEVDVRVPTPLLAVTQGTLLSRKTEGAFSHSRWKGKLPSDGLALVAAKWTYFEDATGPVTVGAYLTEANAAGAQTLLKASREYLALYGDILVPYAYDRFDIVENWFTTGFGMPEFTLLGKHVVMRMLMESARTGGIPPGYLDHEIVHCWWGNLVYPDYAEGNWCEGLTTYCANYLAKEREGPEEARRHRKRTNQRFTLRVTGERDYPVRRFRGKSEDFDDDIGYGKCSMIFHMLRRQIGEPAFWGALRNMARDFAGKRADWGDWEEAFEKTSGRNLTAYFTQWLDRTGAPMLTLDDAAMDATGGRLRVTGTVRQVLREGEQPWTISVPVVVEHLEGIETQVVEMTGGETRFSILVPSMPLRVRVDPDHHVFRRFEDRAIPPCLAATLSRPNVLIVYPDGDQALKALADRAAKTSGAEAVPASRAPTTPPTRTSMLVLGDPERVPLLKTLKASLPDSFPGRRASPDTTVLASARSPVDAREFVTTLTGRPEAVAARARAVFYYQFDGRILFAGRVPKERGDARADDPTSAYVLPDLGTAASAERVREVVDTLAGEDMAGRLAGGATERAARRYVVEQLGLVGLDARERAFSFTVRKLDGSRTPLLLDGATVEGALPFTASPTTDPGGVGATAVATDPEADLGGKMLLIDFPSTSSDAWSFVKGAAELAKARGAVALIVRSPEGPSAKAAELWTFPDALHPETAARLAKGAETGRHGDPLMHAAGTHVRVSGGDELALPTVLAPAGWEPPETGAFRVDVGFELHEVKSANVVATIKGGSKRADGAIVIGAHIDHLGPGFPGADDNASGVAAVIEAGAILAAHADLLGRDVHIVLFGAEEWGLRGSRAYLVSLGEDPGLLAMVNADTVGRAGVADVSVVGVSKHPRLAAVVSAALRQSGLRVGKDVDKYAFAHGSDHYPFHLAGVPAVDLWSGDYRVMHTTADTTDGVDEHKVTRVGHALALTVMALASGF